jgi:hypothetical protein
MKIVWFLYAEEAREGLEACLHERRAQRASGARQSLPADWTVVWLKTNLKFE